MTLLGTIAIARADLGPPRDLVRKTLDDTKKQAADAPEAPKKELDDAKKHARDAVDDALDGGLVTDAGVANDAGPDAGKNDAGDGDDVATKDAEAELDRTRADRGARSRDELRRELATLATDKPVDDALRAELHLHAKRFAWLDRIGAMADAAKDADSLITVKKLLEDESARHYRWLKDWAANAGPK
jgi:hypothetical protein